jgi:hypothetical protein
MKRFVGKHEHIIEEKHTKVKVIRYSTFFLFCSFEKKKKRKTFLFYQQIHLRCCRDVKHDKDDKNQTK